MGKEAGSPPPAPDPYETAAAQAQANATAANQGAVLNRINEITPYGSSFYIPPGRTDLYGQLPNYATAPSGLPTINNPQPGGPVGNGFVQAPVGALPTVDPNAPDPRQPTPTEQSRIAELQNLVGADTSSDEDVSNRYNAKRELERLQAQIAKRATAAPPSQIVGAAPRQQTGANLQPQDMVPRAAAPTIDMSQRPDGSWGVPIAPPGSGQMAAAPAATGSEGMPWTRVSYLDPTEQANLDRQRALASSVLGAGQGQAERIQQAIGAPIDLSGLPAIGTLDFSGLPALPSPADFGTQRNAVEQALYERALQRLNPQFDRDRQALETQLSNQGITVQTNPAAYARAFEMLNNSKNDAMNQALTNATASGGAEQSRLYAMAMQARQQAEQEILTRFQMGMTTRERALQELLTVRNQPINELSALMGSSPGVATPQFAAAPSVNVAPADITGPMALQYQGQLAGYNANVATNNANTGAIASLAAAAVPFAAPALGAGKGMTALGAGMVTDPVHQAWMGR